MPLSVYPLTGYFVSCSSLGEDDEDEDEEEETVTTQSARPRRLSEIDLRSKKQPMPKESSLFMFSSDNRCGQSIILFIHSC